jgi:3-hydroxy-9,10-secoandrosta-1,3,5(10)-triene-9,17-dione monooxygenase reductase component
MSSNAHFNARDFRQTLGKFATGVTIITTRAADGAPVGITVNSFNSVSLDPPMVLWSIAKTAHSRAAFSENGFWNVHILASQQEDLSNRFARAGEDKFHGLTLEPGETPAPLIPGCSARFQCRTVHQYEGGDHIIFVGEVIAYDRSMMPPLLYVTGSYATALSHAGDVATEAASATANPDLASSMPQFSENLLGYLLGRAHFQLMAGIRDQLSLYQLTEADFFVLALLSIRASMNTDDVVAHTAYTGMDIGAATLESLQQRRLLQCSPEEGYSLSETGRDVIAHVLVAAKALESELVARLGEHETATLRNLLKKSIAATDPGLPKLWGSLTHP